MGKKEKLGIRDFLEPLISIPFAWWAIYWFENGFSWTMIIMGIVLWFVLLPAFIVLRGKL